MIYIMYCSITLKYLIMMMMMWATGRKNPKSNDPKKSKNKSMRENTLS